MAVVAAGSTTVTEIGLGEVVLHDGEAGSPATGVGDETVHFDALVTVAEMVTEPFLVVTVAGDATRLAIFGFVPTAPADVATLSVPAAAVATTASPPMAEATARHFLVRRPMAPRGTPTWRPVWIFVNPDMSGTPDAPGQRTVAASREPKSVLVRLQFPLQFQVSQQPTGSFSTGSSRPI